VVEVLVVLVRLLVWEALLEPCRPLEAVGEVVGVVLLLGHGEKVGESVELAVLVKDSL
jgi:hypothetical protein